MTKSKPLPSAEVVRQLLEYNPQTGELSWRVKQGHVTPGKPVRCIGPGGYYRVTIAGRKLLAHRIAWLLVAGKDPGDQQIDHIDGNRLNNRFLNLRLASNAQNQWNKPRSKNNTSGYKGVSFHKARQRWVAQVYSNGKRFFAGYHDTPELAHLAYRKTAAELHGDFARPA
jgi:hypothetical protein